MKIKYKDLAVGAFFKPANKHVYIKESDTKKISTATGYSLDTKPEALVTPLYNVPVTVKRLTETRMLVEYRNEAGQFHREDGPAIEWEDEANSPHGYKEWWLNGAQHREDGPARGCEGWFSEWKYNGELHRLDGPARELSDGSIEYWVNDYKYDNHLEYQAAVEEYKQNQLTVC